MDAKNQNQDLPSDRESHRVYFYPPLHEQRQAWILDTLRGERPRIASILDIGCGEGTLLGVLCQPAECHAVPDDFDARFGVPRADEIELRSVIDTVESMYPAQIAGLDVSPAALERAAELLASQAHGYPFLPPRPRWQELKVQLWRGGLEEYNPAFDGYDCIVSTEVVEHLPEDVLLKFCPIILGRYAPRVFLITTPCYDFNQLFTPPGAPAHTVRAGGFLDPTGRTARVFRHSDHKFEWTRAEFARWCAAQAAQWGYDVACGALGRAVDADPWGRDVAPPGGDPPRATLTAIFRRRADRHPPSATRVGSEPQSQSQSHSEPEPEPGREPAPCAHHRVVDTAHPAHPASRAPLPHAQIRAALQAGLLARRDGPAGEVYDLWAGAGADAALARACGGQLDALFAAVDAAVAASDADTDTDTDAREWAWDGAGRSRWRRRIVWHGYAERARELELELELERARELEMPGEEGDGDGDGEDGPREDDEVSVGVEDSPWENTEAGEEFDWAAGVENGMPDVGWGPIGNDRNEWDRDGEEGWGSPPPVRAELDGWGDWDEQQVGEIKLDGGW